MTFKQLHGDEALEHLREHAGLFPEIPIIELAHVSGPVAQADDGTLLIPICAHDVANKRTHSFIYPVPAGEDLPEATVCLGHIRRMLPAAWN